MSDKSSKKRQSKHKGIRSDWADNEIGLEGAGALGDALKTNTTLSELDLGCERQTQ